MKNEQVLRTLAILNKGRKEDGDRITDSIIHNLSNLKIDLKSELREIAKMFPENENNIYVYGRICRALSYIFYNQPKSYESYKKLISDKDYIDEYKRFLRTWAKVHKVRDIGDLNSGLYDSDILYMDGIRALKIEKVEDNTFVRINGVKHHVKSAQAEEDGLEWFVMRLDDSKENIGAIFFNDEKVEIVSCNNLDDRVKILKKLIQDKFDFALIEYLGCYKDDEVAVDSEMYKKCGIDKLPNEQALSIISLLEYYTPNRSDILRCYSYIKIGEEYIKFRKIKNLTCESILTIIDQCAVFMSSQDSEEEKEKIFNEAFERVKNIDVKPRKEAILICDSIDEIEEKVDEFEGDDQYSYFLDLLKELVE